MKAEVIEKFWEKVSKTDDCWVWEGPTNWRGYGYFYANSKNNRVHRFAYELLVAPIPSGLVIDHLCRNRLCVRPDHLEAVTNKENILRGEAPSAKNVGKTHCVNGHEFTKENTYHKPGKGTHRWCLTCARERMRVYRAKKKSV